MSEVWSDLGYLPKHSLKEWAPLRIPPSPIPNHQHEPDTLRDERRARALSAIRKIDPQAQLESDGSVALTVRGYTYVLYPTSNTYFMPWSERYDYDIEKLCDRISKRLSELG